MSDNLWLRSHVILRLRKWARLVELSMVSRVTIYDLNDQSIPIPITLPLEQFEDFKEWQKDASQKIHGLTVCFPHSAIICTLMWTILAPYVLRRANKMAVGGSTREV